MKFFGNHNEDQKSIFSLTDDELECRFGENWWVAREILDAKKEWIAQGFEIDWDQARKSWDRREAATEGQKRTLEANGYSPSLGLTKYDASFLIDDIFFQQEFDREVMRRWTIQCREEERELERQEKERKREEKRIAREQKKQAHEKEKEQRRLEREEKRRLREEAAKGCSRNRMPVSDKRLQMWRAEFIALWNGILADNLIEIDELLMLKGWLNKHKRQRSDYHDMLVLIDAVIGDGVVDSDEAQSLYAEALKITEALLPGVEESTVESAPTSVE